MIETEDETKQKRPTTTTTTTAGTKKRTIDVSESTVRFVSFEKQINLFVFFFLFVKTMEQQKRGRSSGHTTTSGTSDFYSVGSESDSSYQTAGENDDFKPKFLKKLNDTLATGLNFILNRIFNLFINF